MKSVISVDFFLLFCVNCIEMTMAMHRIDIGVHRKECQVMTISTIMEAANGLEDLQDDLNNHLS